jgi:hypothetical protein
MVRMTPRTPLRFTVFSILTAFALAAAADARAQAPVDPVTPALPQYSVSPNPAPSDKAFTLYLTGAGGGCYTTFSRESVTVIGNRINLSYVANTIATLDPLPADAKANSDLIACPVFDPGPVTAAQTTPIIPPIYSQPTYNMPALKAGAYQVYVTQMYECLYAKPTCKIAVQAVSAGTLTVQASSPSGYSITPTSAAAGKDFQLTLLSYAYNCATTYDNLSVNVSGSTITLSYLDHEGKTGSICPDIYKPYGPTFKVTGLKAGTYKVGAYRIPTCPATGPCTSLGVIMEAGTLTVTDQTLTRSGWYLKDGQVVPDKAFSMQLLKNSVNNCQYSFSNQSATVSAAGIYTSFLMTRDSNRVCIQSISPWGPSFEMKGLAAGAYPVFATELLRCEVIAPICAVDRIMPIASDTLLVSKTSSVFLSQLRAHGPKVEVTGSRASFDLPQGIGGTWEAELTTVAGQHVKSETLHGEGGSRAAFDLGAGARAGIYLLRLQAPDGTAHLMPIVLKN